MSLKMKLLDRGITSEDLDEIVHDAASRLASNANNDGAGSQIEFLQTTCCWTEKEILAALEDDLSE